MTPEPSNGRIDMLAQIVEGQAHASEQMALLLSEVRIDVAVVKTAQIGVLQSLDRIERAVEEGRPPCKPLEDHFEHHEKLRIGVIKAAVILAGTAVTSGSLGAGLIKLVEILSKAPLP